jgi:hypothetical protein
VVALALGLNMVAIQVAQLVVAPCERQTAHQPIPMIVRARIITSSQACAALRPQLPCARSATCRLDPVHAHGRVGAWCRQTDFSRRPEPLHSWRVQGRLQRGVAGICVRDAHVGAGRASALPRLSRRPAARLHACGGEGGAACRSQAGSLAREGGAATAAGMTVDCHALSHESSEVKWNPIQRRYDRESLGYVINWPCNNEPIS